MRAMGGEGGSPDLASHNTAFLPASHASRRRAACSMLPAGHIPVSGSGLLLSTQKPASLSIHMGNFLVPPSPSSVFWEGALSRSLQHRPLPAGTQRDADAPRTCRVSWCLKPVERSWLLKGREGQRAPSSWSCPRLHVWAGSSPGESPRAGRSHWPKLLRVGVAPASAPSRGSSQNLGGRDC